MKTKTECAAIVLLGTLVSGCATAPFIEDSVAKLDANPISVKYENGVAKLDTGSISAKYELPENPPDIITPQPAECLMGTWTAVFNEYTRIEDGRPPNPMNNQSHHRIDSYVFAPDGRYTKRESTIYDFLPIRSNDKTECGKWKYLDGVLTLDRENLEIKMMHGDEILHKTSVTEPQTIHCQVEWISDKEILVKNDSAEGIPSLGMKVTTKVDKLGIKTTRMVNVTGSRDGRETGDVWEIATSVRFAKKAEKE